MLSEMKYMYLDIQEPEHNGMEAGWDQNMKRKRNRKL